MKMSLPALSALLYKFVHSPQLRQWICSRQTQAELILPQSGWISQESVRSSGGTPTLHIRP